MRETVVVTAAALPVTLGSVTRTLTVINQLGQVLGRVDHLLETGANDVLVVKPFDGSLDDRERLLPYTDPCVLKVDLGAGEMHVEWDADF